MNSRLFTFFTLLAAGWCHSADASRERILFDDDWRFAFGHACEPAQDFHHATGYFSYLAKAGFGDGPAAADFDDRAWRQLDLPHDWAVEAPFSPHGSHSHGYKAVGKGFPQRSIGWYRKRFHIPKSDLGRHITISFDGAFRAARVWVNGFYLGEQPSGYTAAHYDLSDYLNYGAENTISVRVDASLEEGWFYEGAGIYRHVWLVKTHPVHVGINGTYVTTNSNADSAQISIQTELRHTGREAATVAVSHQVLAPDGTAIADTTVADITVAAGAHQNTSAQLTVPFPQRWSHHSPHLHHLITTVHLDGREIDRCTTPFGIREIVFDPDAGFFINGESVKLKGVNLHQDHAGVGAALPDALFTYRLQRLRAFGVNAIRTGHRPPAPELLAACDRLGFYVIDEHRLMGTNPAQLNDLRDMIRRDRNHPSVILWSVGNEEWAIEGNIKGARITQRMQDFVHRLEPTRRVTVAISGGWGGSSTVADVVGYNYINQSDPDQQHADYPHQPGLGTEETTTQSTRGIFFDDPARGHLAPREAGDTGGNNEKGWTYYAARPFLAGIFYWTGFDYRGEPTPYGWPAVSSQFGLLDLCGFPKDSTYYQKAWWTDDPVLHISPHWNWSGREGEPIKVVVYSNHDDVELLLNGMSLGRQNLPRNSKLTWQVPYVPGRLEARAYRDGDLVQITSRETTGPARQLTLSATRPAIGPDGRAIIICTVSATDAADRPVPTAHDLVSFEITGGSIIGVGNGDPGSHERDRFPPTDTHLAITDWHGHIVPADQPLAASPDNLPPLNLLGRWGAPTPDAGEIYELTGTFTIGTLPSSVTIDLFLPRLGDDSSLWLNGTPLVADHDTRTEGLSLSLPPDQLRPGTHRILLRVTPSAGPTRIPERDAIGLVRVREPAPPAQRRLFNGLAQVIVERSAPETPVSLTAHSPDLVSAQLTLK